MRLLPAESRPRSAILAAALALCSAYSVHHYVYAPVKREADAARLRLAELQDRSQRAETTAGDGAAALERRLALYEDHVARLEKLIPADNEVSALLEAISAEERRAGVNVAVMRPEPPELGEFYKRRSYELQVEGGYHEVGTFMTAIASLERVVASTDVSITPASPPGLEGGGQVVANFWIRTYSKGR